MSSAVDREGCEGIPQGIAVIARRFILRHNVTWLLIPHLKSKEIRNVDHVGEKIQGSPRCFTTAQGAGKNGVVFRQRRNTVLK